MDARAQYIKQRLSLREPLKESLDIVSDVTAKLSLKKEANLAEELKKISEAYPKCTDFERDFPSICFSIATGVGKTRLMGACIAYLYLEKGIRNFFVLAPNLTIYEKLIDDFGNPSNPKYVFNGIAEFVHNRPVIITGDNYDSQGALFSDTEIRINVFNISKFNKDANTPTRGAEKGKLPRIKRLAEYLGQSYWDYLSNLNDLVILMDEAHRYKADSSAAAVNDLKPVLGIELTATPLDEKGNVFKNVVYEYNLAQALADGKYVKNPAIAYRSDFQAQGKTDDDVEKIKLEDAISLHEDVKTELEVYANSTGNKKVKPFILVVCKDTTHAKEVLAYIKSNAFYAGQYADKVIQIDSSVNDEQNAKLLETVEHYDNPVEIVIHVNMLAEGWDVTNLYTICPLRKADSVKLIEQTIGRGLRLPYKGERTGVEKIDRLTVIAHDNFQKVIAAAKDPNSILNRFTYVEIDPRAAQEKTQAVVSVPTIILQQQEEQKQVDAITNPEQKQKAQTVVDAKKAIIEALPTLGKIEGVTKVDDLRKPEIKKQVIAKIEQQLNTGQQNIFKEDLVKEVEVQYENVINSYKKNIIEIPRIDLVQDEVKTWFEDFDLDTSSGFDIRVLKEEIIVQGLKDDTITRVGVLHGAQYKETPVNLIISELINYPELDYDQCPDLLHKLATQAINKLSEGLSDPKELQTLVRQSRKIIANRIWTQMKAHFRQSKPEYGVPNVLPFTAIEQWSFSAPAKDGYKDYRTNIPARDVTKYVFMGFAKSCHPQYKFDSSSEKDLATVLEQDPKVEKWLRPAERQFRIYWANNSKQYYPDFVVEEEQAIYLVEVKAANQIDTGEVQDKKKAAEMYCKYASEYSAKNGKKTWKYALIPHDAIQTNFSFDHLLNRAE
jgi:type III restriction enzyme